MSQVSRRPIKKETEEKVRLLFCQTIASCSSPTAATELLEDLLTPTEQIMLAKRLAIAHLLIKGYSYESIKSILKVSTPTIGSISRLLKVKGAGLRNSLEHVIKDRSWQAFFQEINDVALDIMGHAKGSNWKAAERHKHQRVLEKQSPL